MLKTWLIAFASLLIFTCDLMLVIDVWRAREAALDEAARSVERLSLAAKEHASRSFADVDHVLASLAETLAVRMAETEHGHMAPGDPELTRLLLRRLAGLDNVRAITVINEMGIRIIDSRIDIPVGIDLSDRGYFIAQRQGTGDALYLDRPAISRIDGRQFIGASRRINRPGGSFAGVVAAVIDPEPLHAFYASLAAGRDRSLVLARDDETIYIQEPAGDRAGAVPTVLTCGDLSGTDGTASVSASSQIVSCQRVPRYPFTAIASTPVEAVLAPWRGDALQRLFAALLMTVSITVFTRMLVRRIGSQEAAERQLRDAIESMSDSFLLFDADDRLILSNSRCREMLSPVADSIRPGTSYREIREAMVRCGLTSRSGADGGAPPHVHPEECRSAEPPLEERLSTGDWLLTRTRPTRDGGRVRISSDITFLKRAENRFRLAFDTNPDAMGITRLETGYFVDVNQGFIDLTGYVRDEVIGRESTDIAFWADPRDREPVIARLRKRGRIRNEEIRIRHKDGRVITALNSARVFSLDGEPHIIFNIRNVSEIRAIEDELSKLWLAVEQAPALVIITDVHGTIEYVNPKFREITGYSREEAIGKNPRLLKSGAMDAEQYARLWSEITSGREWRGEICNKRKDGTPYWASVSISPVKHHSGNITHFIGIQNDITERKLAEQELQASKERFQRLVESSVLGIVIDRDGVPLYANRTYAEIFGYGGPEEIVALASLNSLYAGTELDRINSYRSTCQRGWCAPKEYEFQGVKKDGSLIWIRAHLNTVTWNGGAAVQWTIVDITLRKSYEHRLYYQANFDGITGLPNRTLALERLQNAVAAARRDQRPLAILFIDVDHFKKINDTLGHAQGDLLLELVGERMKACIREPDTVARMGGDEFAVILPDVRDSQDVAAVARRILDSFAKPFKLDGFETFVTASIGIALGPENGDDAETLLRNADAALYSAKEKGRNTYCFFNRELTEKAAERLRMEAHLRRALEREEFWLAYQPLVDIRSGRLAGAEVLLRWRNESLGQVNTDDFISLAESTGLIVPIGQWVLDTACRQASRWQTEGLGPIPLSINVSSCQFRGPFLADAVSAALRTNGMSPSCLELEITERLLMGNHPEAKDVIEKLKGLGVRLALDDFGTGYSSLSYLSRFPVDTLKIDKSFIREVPFNASNVALVEAIIAMAHGLHLRVVAEGVETREQLDFLRKHGCDLAQGYFFSAPVPADGFAELARGWRHIAARAG